jgi:hypothetical protein
VLTVGIALRLHLDAIGRLWALGLLEIEQTGANRDGLSNLQAT